MTSATSKSLNMLPKCDINFATMDVEYENIKDIYCYSVDTLYSSMEKMIILVEKILDELDLFVSNIISSYDLNKLLEILAYRRTKDGRTMSTKLFQELKSYNYYLKQSTFCNNIKLIIIIDSINCIDDLIKYVNNNDFNKIIIKTLLYLWYFSPYRIKIIKDYDICTHNITRDPNNKYSYVKFDRSEFDKSKYLKNFRYNVRVRIDREFMYCADINTKLHIAYFKNLYTYDYILYIPSNIKIKELENTIDQLNHQIDLQNQTIINIQNNTTKIKELENTIDQLKHQVDLQNQTITIMQHQLTQLLKK